MSIDLLPPYIREHYEVREWKHASAILHQDFPQEWADIVLMLEQYQAPQKLDSSSRRAQVADFKLDRQLSL